MQLSLILFSFYLPLLSLSYAKKECGRRKGRFNGNKGTKALKIV